MRLLRKFLDSQSKHFQKGGNLESIYPLYEAVDTFLFTPSSVTKGSSHIRDALDLKRMMITVVIALIPPIFMAMYNTGYQAHLAISKGAIPLETWQTVTMHWLGLANFSPEDFWACLIDGSLYFLRVLVLTFFVGGNCEALFAIVRKHEINEGFLVTGMLFPLVLPPTIPLWQVALGIAFGVILGKEIFGGTGMNILNPALTARAFLFFAYPADISGDRVWIAANTSVDGISGATWLAETSDKGLSTLTSGLSWWDAFIGLVPGSMGETSALACLIGAMILIFSKIGSWRIILGVGVGSLIASTFLNMISSETNPLLTVPFWWHIVLGGWAFGTVYMATDPVSASHSNTGKYIYGLIIGLLAILIRVVNPAYPEGMMLAILFVNLFAGLIDYFVIQANVKRRRKRYAA